MIDSKTAAEHAVFELNALEVIDARGAEAEAFLQGQLSNDVAATDPSEAQLNAYCNPQGRAVAVLRLIRHGRGFWLIVPLGMAQPLLTRLKMFVLRAKVSLELALDIAQLGVVGGAELRGELPSDIHCASVAGSAAKRQILLGARKNIDLVERNLVHKRGAAPAADGIERWRCLDILSGIPQVYRPTAAAFIPQMINLDAVDGVSFSKGCYPGQEIIARLRHLGKPKKRLVLGRVRNMLSLQPGDEIYASASADTKAGVVVDAVRTAVGEYTLSATAPTTHVQHGDLLVASGAEATRMPLQRIDRPYAVSD